MQAAYLLFSVINTIAFTHLVNEVLVPMFYQQIFGWDIKTGIQR